MKNYQTMTIYQAVVLVVVVVVVVVTLTVAGRGNKTTKVAVVVVVAKVAKANTIRGTALRMGNQAVGSGRKATAIMPKDGELATDGQLEEAALVALGSRRRRLRRLEPLGQTR